MSADILWRTVILIRVRIVYERAPVLKGPAKYLLPETESRSYELFTLDEKEYFFNGTTTKNIGRFGKVLSQIAAREKIQWVVDDEHG